MDAFKRQWNSYFTGKRQNLILRYAVLLIGVYLIAFSIALARTAGLGTSPIASIPNVLSIIFVPITIGTFQFFYNLLMIIGQVVLRRHWRRPVEFFQIFIVFYFSVAVDFNVWLLQGLPVPNYLIAWIWTFSSIVLLALGIVFELAADVTIMPGEGIVLAISDVFRLKFSRVKVCFDTGNLLTGALISLLVMGGLYGVREGTIATALLTGVFVGFFKRFLSWLQSWIPERAGIEQVSNL